MDLLRVKQTDNFLFSYGYEAGMDGKWTEKTRGRLPGHNLPRLGPFLDGEKLPAKIANI